MAGGWPGPRRRMVGVKLSDEQIAEVDRLAVGEGLTVRGYGPNRSEMLRRLLDEALAARRRATPSTVDG